jgi:hypothetical protein
MKKVHPPEYLKIKIIKKAPKGAFFNYAERIRTFLESGP